MTALKRYREFIAALPYASGDTQILEDAERLRVLAANEVLEARAIQALALLELDRAARAYLLTDAQRDDCTTALRLADTSA